MNSIGMVAGLVYSALILASNFARSWRVRVVATALVFDVAAIVCYAAAGDWWFAGVWLAIGGLGVFLLFQARRLVSLQAEEREAEQRYKESLARLMHLVGDDD